MSLISIRTTVDSEDIAQHMAKLLVENGLVGCAHVHHVHSCYIWQEKTQESKEWLLEVITMPWLDEGVRSAIKDMHPYALPAIYTIELAAVDPNYAHWINERVDRRTK